ncbi:MAG: hypothetical protein Q8Q09_06665 [Deltaproteobacteria bacterium]|nr:hypothetical protein [Deltaproteobacteria bacterium]
MIGLKNYSVLLAMLAFVGACNSGNPSAPVTVDNNTTAGGQGSTEMDGDASVPDAGRPRSGMSLHIEGVTIGGALVAGDDLASDALEINFGLQISHFGAQDLADVRVRDVRAVADNGVSVDFDAVPSEDFDGRIAAGSTRTIAYRKRPDSGVPRVNRTLCNHFMRVELTVALGDTGRTSRVQSRQVRVQCTPVTPSR